MSNRGDNKSIASLGTNYSEKKYDSIPMRVDFIKTLLNGKELKPLLNFENTDTENFTGSSIKGDDENLNSDDMNDTRNILAKNTHDFNHIFTQLKCKLVYIKSGTTGHTFKGTSILDDGAINYGVKVVAYPRNKRYGDLYDVHRPENAELMMIRLLAQFVVKKQNPHIVLPISTFDTDIKPFTELLDTRIVPETNRKYAGFIDNYKKGYYYDKVSILISEWCNRGDFLDFIKNYYKSFNLLHWQVFFFQIISVLGVIQHKYPKFRHNDLKANNVLITKSNSNRKSFTYTVCKNKYIVPNIGYQLKLWDFDFACIPGIVNNSKVSDAWTNKINVKPERNQYYDIHYFFNTLIRKGFFPQFMKEACVPEEAKEFVKRILPINLRSGNNVSESGRLMINEEYVTPDMILKNDPFFEKFRNGYYKQYINRPKVYHCRYCNAALSGGTVCERCYLKNKK